jgi:hypothetical protein
LDEEIERREWGGSGLPLPRGLDTSSAGWFGGSGDTKLALDEIEVYALQDGQPAIIVPGAAAVAAVAGGAGGGGGIFRFGARAVPAAAAGVVPAGNGPMGSAILTQEHKNHLLRFFSNAALPHILLYRASHDGFAASDWQRKCLNKGPTLTVVKSECGNIFGQREQAAHANAKPCRRNSAPSLDQYV